MRYLPLTDGDRSAMLAEIGASSIDDLYTDVPESARLDGLVDIPLHQGELEVERAMAALAAKNLDAGQAPFFVGAGAYRHHVPATVDHLIQRSEFLTAYTPYQPEISQGTLQSLFEFQTQVALLTGSEVANASMYDGSTACAEAVLMARRVTKRANVILSGGLHPHYRDVTATALKFSDGDLTLCPPDPGAAEDMMSLIDGDTACVVVQTPDLFGNVRDLRPLTAAAHDAGALLIAVFTEAMSLGALMSPGEMGADIVVGEGQSIGNSLNFGGPNLGLFATRQRYVRQMPGRLCGETVDADGRPGYVLTLSTREQHIRREKATSNICTNSGLCALAFCIHLALLGEEGLTRVARLNHKAAVTLAAKLDHVTGVEVLNDTFFNEFTVRVDGPADQVVEQMAAAGVLGGVPVSRLYPDVGGLADLILIAATECTTEADMDALASALGKAVAA
jgi:glycine dehydrogenase subunit 1